MNNQPGITCSDIKDNVKQLLDDRLVEKEYHAFFRHLESCLKCKEYVRAIGSLSNQIWKLSEVEVPADLSSSIIFKLKQSGDNNEAQPSSELSTKVILGAIIMIAGLFVFFGTGIFLKTPEPSSGADNAGIVEPRSIKEQEPVSDEEAEYLFSQLRAMAQSLEPISNGKSVREVSRVKVSKEGNLFLFDGSPETGKRSAPVAYSLHWHIPYSKEAEISQLVDTIKNLEIDLNYEDKNFLIFEATSGKLKLLSDQIQLTNKWRLDLPEFISAGYLPDKKTLVSVCFSGRDPVIYFSEK